MSSDSDPDENSLSPEHGFRCIPEPSVDLEDLLLAVGEEVGCENIISASNWGDGVAVFLNNKHLVNMLIENGIFINDVFLEMMPFVQPEHKNFAPNALSSSYNRVEVEEATPSGKFASPKENDRNL